ncbi:MAG: hypothetical protein U1F43_00830 [Myxococcota bacterium]
MHPAAWLLGSLALVLTAWLGAACGDPSRPAHGGTCDEAAACASGLCWDGQCLDPSGDDDGDSLTNGVEAGLGSDPFAPDSDGDGRPDGSEVVDGVARDQDGDGRPDIIESATADADGDCLVDERDPHDSVPDAGHCADADASDGGDATASDADDAVDDATAPSDAVDATTAPSDVGDTTEAPDVADSSAPDVTADLPAPRALYAASQLGRPGFDGLEGNLTDSGVVVLEGVLTGATSDDYRAFVATTHSRELAIVAQQGDPIGVTPPGGDYFGFFSVIGNDTTVLMGLDTVDFNGMAHVVTTAPTAVVAAENVALPGTSEGVESAMALRYRNDGSIVFTARLAAPCTVCDGAWIGKPGALVPLLFHGDAAPGYAADVIVADPGEQSVCFTRDGKVAMQPTVHGSAIGNVAPLLFGAPGQLARVAVDGEVHDGVAVDTLSGYSANAHGELAFVDRNGLWRWSASTGAALVLPATTLVDGQSFDDWNPRPPRIGDDGVIVFADRLDGVPTLLTFDTAAHVVVQAQTPAPGLAGRSLRFLDLDYQRNARGDIAFGATLDDDTRAAWIIDAAGTPHLVLHSDATIPSGGGAVDTVLDFRWSTLSPFPSPVGPSRECGFASPFTDDGQLGLTVDLTRGTVFMVFALPE